MLTEGKWKIELGAPHQVYKNAAGKRLPGVTTVQSVFDKPALRRWGLGMERDSLLQMLESWREFSDMTPEKYVRLNLPAPNDKGEPTYFSEQFTQKAADVGTVAHARCEAYLHGVELDETGLEPEVVAKSMNGFKRFVAWWESEKLTVLHSELQLVSERDQTGGTLDIVARRPDGSLILADLKTTKASRYWPFVEVFGQVSQYASMYEEVVTGPIADIVVVRIGKEADDPGQQHWLTKQERVAGKKLFDAARIAYEVRKELSRG